MSRSYTFILKNTRVLFLLTACTFYGEAYASNSVEEDQKDSKTAIKLQEYPDDSMNLGTLSQLPKELVEIIFSYCPQQIPYLHHLNRSAFTIMTGYSSEDMSKKGMANPPSYWTYPFASTKKVNFKRLPSQPEDIPSYLWFKKIVSVEYIPKEYWHYIKDTQVQFVKLKIETINERRYLELQVFRRER